VYEFSRQRPLPRPRFARRLSLRLALAVLEARMPMAAGESALGLVAAKRSGSGPIGEVFTVVPPRESAQHQP
jgi:hypothetical protein